MARTINLARFIRKMSSLVPDIEEYVLKGLRNAAIRLQEYVVEELERVDAVDTGELKGSIYTKIEGIGVTTGCSAPHASFVEFGTRPHFPPVDPIFQWVLSKGLTDDPTEAESIAFAIVKRIGRYGTRPRFFMQKALNRFEKDKVIEQEIRKELEILERKRS